MDFYLKSKQIEESLSDFITYAMSGIEKGIPEFPDVNDLFLGGFPDLKVIMRTIAEYEFEQVKIANLAAEISTNKINLKNYTRRIKQLIDSEEFSQWQPRSREIISILVDMEASLKTKSETIKECINTLRSIQANMPK